MSEAKKILLIGAGGHCLSVLDSLLSSYYYKEIGIVDKDYGMVESSNKILKQRFIMDKPIVGNDHDLERLFSEGYTEAFIAVGSIGDVSVREKLYQFVKNIGYHIPNIIDKTAIISTHAICGEGIYVGKKAVVNANTQIGNCAIINTSSVIEHECDIGDFVHIAPGSIICGNVHIGNKTHIGAGCVIKQGVQVGEESMIGAGSVVVKNVRNGVVAFGTPCKEV